MKKILFIIIPLLLINIIGLSQSYYATLSVDTIDISKLSPGDEIIAPVRLKKKSGGLIIGFQFYIDFDHSLFTWKGESSTPLNGVKNFNTSMPYNSNDWLFNDNGNQIVALWLPTDMKVEIESNDVFFELIFIYNGSFGENNQFLFSWGITNEQKDGRIVRGKTEMYSEKMDLYNLTLINGVVIQKK